MIKLLLSIFSLVGSELELKANRLLQQTRKFLLGSAMFLLGFIVFIFGLLFILLAFFFNIGDLFQFFQASLWTGIIAITTSAILVIIAAALIKPKNRY